MLGILQLIVEQGLIFSLVICGVYLTSRIIGFDDLTVEGSFGLGGAMTAWGLIAGLHGWTILAVSLLVGAIAGLLTALLHTKLRINGIMCGIIVMTALYSINLKIAGAHVPLIHTARMLDKQASLAGLPQTLLVLGLLAALVVALLTFTLRTQVGFLLRAVGQNEQIIICLGKRPALYKVAALMAANALTAAAGSLFAQHMGFFSMSSSVGVLVIALAGVTLGLVMGGGLWRQLICGSLAYPTVLAIVLQCELDPVYNKLAIAAVMGLLLLKQHLNSLDTRKATS